MWVNFVEVSKSHRHHIKDSQKKIKLLYTYIIFAKETRLYLQYGVVRVSQ